jgi:hypothetical protein
MTGKTTVFGTGVAGGDVTLPITPSTVGTGAEAADFASLAVAGGIGPAAVFSKTGTVVLNGATPVAIADTGLTANSILIFTLKTPGGTVGAYPNLVTATPGTGSTVAGTALDTSTYNWARIG